MLSMRAPRYKMFQCLLKTKIRLVPFYSLRQLWCSFYCKFLAEKRLNFNQLSDDSPVIFFELETRFAENDRQTKDAGSKICW